MRQRVVNLIFFLVGIKTHKEKKIFLKMFHGNHICLNVTKTHDVTLGNSVSIRAKASCGSGFYQYRWTVYDKKCLRITSKRRSYSTIQILALKLSSQPIQIKVVADDLNILQVRKHKYIFVVIHPIPPIPLTLISVGQLVLINLNVAESKYLSFSLLSPLPSGLIFKNNLITGILEANPTYPQPVDIAYVIKTRVGSYESEAQKSSLSLRLHPSLNVLMTLTPNSRLLNVGDIITVMSSVSGGSGIYISHNWELAQSDNILVLTTISTTEIKIVGMLSGSSLLSLTVTDSLNNVDTVTLDFLVFPRVSLTLEPPLTLSGSRPTLTLTNTTTQTWVLTLGQVHQVKATVIAGMSPYLNSFVNSSMMTAQNQKLLHLAGGISPYTLDTMIDNAEIFGLPNYHITFDGSDNLIVEYVPISVGSAIMTYTFQDNNNNKTIEIINIEVVSPEPKL